MPGQQKLLLAFQYTTPVTKEHFVRINGYVQEAYGDSGGIEPAIFSTEPCPVGKRDQLKSVLTKLGFEGSYKFFGRNRKTRVRSEMNKIGVRNVQYVALVDLEKEEVQKIWEQPNSHLSL